MIPADDWSDVISEFAIPGGLVLERRTGGGTVNAFHEVVPPGTVTITLDPVAVVPSTGRQRQRDADERHRETIDVYATVAIYAGDASRMADVILYQGRRYSVSRVQDYGAAGSAWIASAELTERVS